MQFVTDIVRRKLAPESAGTKRMKRIKAVSKALWRSSGARVPFFVGLVLILAEAVLVAKTAMETFEFPSTTEPPLAAAKPEIPAEAAQAVLFQSFGAAANLPLSTSTATSTEPLELPEVKPDLLPTVKLNSPKKASAAPAPAKEKSAAQSSQPKPAPTPTPTTIIAHSLIDATTISLSERHDGPYIATLETNAGTFGKLKWGLGQSTLKVGTLNFSISYSCDQFLGMPAPEALDQNPMLEPKTAYTCKIGLTPTSGNDRQTQSKGFSFTTPPGQLVVKLQSSMSTVLRNDSNFGGFILRNDDPDPVTVTDLYFDVSYRGLSTDYPTAVRFENPASQQPFADYRLDDMALDPAVPYGHSASDVHVSLFFTIPGSDQKLLPVNALGVHKLGIYGVDPTITVTLRKVVTNPSANKVVLSSPVLSWSCIVPLGAYDPNNPTGAYATGRACQQ